MRRVVVALVWAACLATVAVPLAQSAPPAGGDEPPAILVSRQLLESQELRAGDIVQLAADGSGSNARAFRIAGSYEPVANPMRLGAERFEVRLHLPDLIALTADPTDPLAAESISAINVVLTDPSSMADVAREISTRVPGVLATAAAGGEGTATQFVVLQQFHLAIALVTAVASAVFLLALMVIRIEERRETVGILRLIGFRRGRILLQVFAEGLLIALVGAIVGVLLAAAWQPGINLFFQWRYDTALVFVRVTPSIALRCLALAVPLGMLASVVASWTLLRRDVLALARR